MKKLHVLFAAVFATASSLGGCGGGGGGFSGSKIVFASNRDGNFEIYVMNADGSGQTRLTNNANSDASPSFPLN